MNKNLDKIQGCLLGGAAGDALGYAVEFCSERVIAARYGQSGITQYQLQDGLGRISDDTQMTLFTANGLLVGDTQGLPCGDCSCIARAYREWYKTQMQSFAHINRKFLSCWLMNVPELYAERAPGNTCMAAIDDGCCGSVAAPSNDSKGCGGVMRVAPIGLYFDERWTDREVDLLGAGAAALTHGHDMGYVPAALLVHIVRAVSQRENASLKAVVLEGMDAVEQLFPQAEHMPEFLELMSKAIALSERDMEDVEAIHEIGPGWCGDEALAVAVYCALKYEQDFDKALIAAVNHSGDSDSTGAITGNILGAHLGRSRIPEKYIENLELRDVILEIAGDLYAGCPAGFSPAATDPSARTWAEKYVQATYGLNR